MLEAVREIWAFQFALVPVLCAYLIFELPTLIRRYARVAYVPVYFLFFPLGHADELYAEYFNEDFFYIGAQQSPQEKHKVRKRLMVLSIVSIAFAAVVSPALAGLFSSVFLGAIEFDQFFWFLIAVKSVLIFKALKQAKHYLFVHTSGSFPMIVAIYILYLAIVCRVVSVAYDWGTDLIAKSGVVGMLLGAIDLLIFDLGIYIIAAGAIGGALSYWLTDPDNIPTTSEAAVVEVAISEYREMTNE